MQLVILFAIVCALAQAEADRSLAGEPAARALFVALGMIVAPLVALGLPLEQSGLRSKTAAETARYTYNNWRRRRRAATFAWLATIAATLYILKWPQVVRADWQLVQWPLVDELLILGPVVVPLLLLWSAQHAALRRAGLAEGSAWRHVCLKARQELAIVILPALVVIAALDLPATSSMDLQGNGAWTWFLWPLPAVALLALPAALRRVWHTSPLPAGPLRERLLGVCREQRVTIGEILVWHTPQGDANAAIAGLARCCRYVFLTDGLLARLTADEIEAVLRHELAHVRRWHLALRMLVLVLPLVLWMAVGATWPGWSEWLSARLVEVGLARRWQVSLLVPAALFGYVVAIVGGYSRWLEHEADLEACFDSDGKIDPHRLAAFCRALVKVVGTAGENRWGNWLHPPLARRLALLHRARDNAQFARGLRCTLRRAAWMLVGVFVLAVLCVALAPLAQQSPAAHCQHARQNPCHRQAFARFSAFAPEANEQAWGRQPKENQTRFAPYRSRVSAMPTQTTLFDRVEGAILSNSHLAGRRLRLEAAEGRVVLQGVVSTYFQKQIAQEIVRRVEGVHEIENRLEVNWLEPLPA